MKIKGDLCRCPRRGGLGQGQHLLWRRISQSEMRNSAAAEKPKRAKNSFPPTPFLFARPSENYQKSASGFSRKKVRILTKRYRQFSDRDFWAIVASPRQRRGSASARILKGFLKSKSNFCPLKRKVGLPKANINLKNLLTNLFSFRLWRKAKQ